MSDNLFETVCEMETPLTVAVDLAMALASIAETIDDDDSRVVQRLAWMLRDQIEAAEERRGELFHLTHPRRHELERERTEAEPEPVRMVGGERNG